MIDSSRVSYYEVPAERAGQRIDNLLQSILDGVPKTLVYRWLRKGEVRINSGRCKPNQRLQAGDKVRIPPVKQKQKQAIHISAPERVKPWIIEQNEHLWVINKPSGLAVHGGSGVRYGVIDLLRAWKPEQWFELIHRLDRDTSGCLWVARQRQSLLNIQQAFRNNRVDKRYLCLMHGKLSQSHIRVDFPLRKTSSSQGEARVLVDEDNGKPSTTIFRQLESYRNWTLAEAKLETGRTHQIRVHAAALGHPLAGDRKYANEQSMKDTTLLGLSRLFLHCSSMRLHDEVQGFDFHTDVPLPDELRSTLDPLQ